VLLLVHHELVISREVVVDTADGHIVMDMGGLVHARIYDLSSRKTVSFDDSQLPKKRLIIFLTSADCASCLSGLGDWILLSQKYQKSEFEIDLVYVSTSESEIKSFKRSYDYPYSSYFDIDGDVVKHVGIPSATPVTVLVDSNFKVLAAEGAEEDMDARRRFVSRVNTLIEQ